MGHLIQLGKLTILLMCFCLGALDHIVVTTQDGKFPLNQLGQVSMKTPQLIMINMSSFPEVRRSHTQTHTYRFFLDVCVCLTQTSTL